MVCKRCNGRVLVDRVFTTETHVELFCFACGKRWSLSHPLNLGAFALWLWKKEKNYMKKSQAGQ
jgi:hypothetical protein